MNSELHGTIPFQDEIYVSTEPGGYVVLTIAPAHADEKRIAINAANIDALIRLLAAAKASLVGG